MNKECSIDTKYRPHDHPEHPDRVQRSSAKKRLRLAFAICLSMIGVELVGALFSGSLALLADATHMAADALSLGMTILAAFLAERLRSPKRSYGYYRLEVLAALANGALLLGMAAFILTEAYHRIHSLHPVNGLTMLSVGLLGLSANIIMLWIMAPAHNHNLNIKGAFFHVIGDTLASIAVIIGAFFILFSKDYWPDIVASAFVAVMIILMAVRLIWDSVHILLEGTPKHMDPREIENDLKKEFPTIRDIHDFHIWEITSHLFAMTAHLRAEVQNLEDTHRLIDGINRLIREKYGIGHTTFQVEPYRKNEA